MRKLLQIASFLFYPVPYPYAGGYHFLVGATLYWWIRYGASTSYKFSQVLAGGGIGLLVGALGCMLFGYLLAKQEEKDSTTVAKLYADIYGWKKEMDCLPAGSPDIAIYARKLEEAQRTIKSLA